MNNGFEIKPPAKVFITGANDFIGRALARLFGGQSELGKGTMDMLARKAGYSIAKAGRLLGYEPQVDLAEGMRRSEAWAREAGLI